MSDNDVEYELFAECQQHLAQCRQCAVSPTPCAAAKFLQRAYNNAKRRNSLEHRQA